MADDFGKLRRKACKGCGKVFLGYFINDLCGECVEDAERYYRELQREWNERNSRKFVAFRDGLD